MPFAFIAKFRDVTAHRRGKSGLQDGYDMDGFLREFTSVDHLDAEEFPRLVSGELERS